MKIVFSVFACLFSFFTVTAQDYKPSPEQIEANKRFEEAKKQFLSGKYESVLNYYDSLLTKSKSTRFETYKMASESCLKLSTVHAEDSLTLINKANQIYADVVKWYGKMQVTEKWDSQEITINNEPEVFTIIENQPEFPGGMAALYKYVGNELRYPSEAREKGIEGKVYIQFVVNKDGSIDAVNAVEGIGGGCDEEAVRVVKGAPNFSPGLQDGKPVYVRMVLPIIFRLAGKPPKKKRKRRGE